MKTICCICKKLIKDDKINDGLTSHGYCDICYEYEQRKLTELLEKEKYFWET